MYIYIYGWLSKLWALFGYPKYKVPFYNRDPKRAHNFDNHLYIHTCVCVRTELRRCICSHTHTHENINKSPDIRK